MVTLLRLVIALLCCCGNARETSVKPVQKLKVDLFLGRWYQMYTSYIPKQSTERNAHCVVIDVSTKGIRGNVDTKAMTVFATANHYRPGGSIRAVKGMAVNHHHKSKPGVWHVNVGQTQGVHIVLALGTVPIGKSTNNYPWAVITDEIGGTISVLAGDIKQFRLKYEKHVLELVRERGFTEQTNRPIEMYQSRSKCRYPPFLRDLDFGRQNQQFNVSDSMV